MDDVSEVWDNVYGLLGFLCKMPFFFNIGDLLLVLAIYSRGGNSVIVDVRSCEAVQLEFYVTQYRVTPWRA